MAQTYPLPLMMLLTGRAFVALARARILLHRTAPEDVLRMNQRSKARAGAESQCVSPSWAQDRCDRVAFFIPRLAHRVPWRADCLVQALAGQQLLTQDRIASEIVVGTAKQLDGTFAAHAWLCQSERIVLGGDVGDFVPLLDSQGLLQRVAGNAESGPSQPMH